MTNATPLPLRNSQTPLDMSAATLSSYMRRHVELMEALATIRHYVDNDEEVMSPLEEVRPVAVLRLSFELFLMLCADEEVDPYELLLEHCDEDTVHTAVTGVLGYCHCEYCED
jgi:hypothetical protein